MRRVRRREKGNESLVYGVIAFLQFYPWPTNGDYRCFHICGEQCAHKVLQKWLEGVVTSAGFPRTVRAAFKVRTYRRLVVEGVK
jgi:hypothetical protein